VKKLIAIILIVSTLLCTGCTTSKYKVDANIENIKSITTFAEVESQDCVDKNQNNECYKAVSGKSNTGDAASTTPINKKLGLLSTNDLKLMQDFTAEELKNSISTIKDAVNYITQFNTDWFTMMDQHDTFTVDVVSSLNKVRNAKRAGTDDITTFVFYVLSDDYPDMGMVVGSFISSGIMWANTALTFKDDGGYYVISPVILNNVVEMNDNSSTSIGEFHISSLNELPINCGFDESIIGTWHYIDSTQTCVRFDMSSTAFNVITGSSTVIYTDGKNSVITKEMLIDDKRFNSEKVLEYNWSYCNFPNTDTKPAWSDVESWTSLTLQELDKKINSVEDMFYYFAASGYNYCDPGVDIDYADKEIDGLVYHFNKSPAVILKQNYGCCGATAGLVAYLLNGDYEEVGIIDMTFKFGEGGGHVINYIKSGGKYYVFDSVNFTIGYNPDMLNCCSSSTLIEAGKKWANSCPWNVKAMRACIGCIDGDSITGWKYMTDDHTTYIPETYNNVDYKNNSTIILETVDEGYIYQWVNLSEDAQNVIHSVRN